MFYEESDTHMQERILKHSRKSMLINCNFVSIKEYSGIDIHTGVLRCKNLLGKWNKNK